MNCSSTKLREAFSLVSKLATGRATLPILSCIRLEARRGVLSICATNLDAWAVSRCDCEGGLKPIAVPAFAFGALLLSAGDEVTLESKENLRLSFISRSKSTLACLDADEFPASPPSGQAIGVNTEDLAACVEAVTWARYDGIDRPMLQCVSVETSGNEIKAVATNGRVMGLMQIPDIAADSRFVALASYSPMFCQALTLPEAVLEVSEKFVLVKTPSLDIAVKQTEGEYPNTRPVVDHPCTAIGTVNRDELLSVLRTILMLARSDGKDPNTTGLPFVRTRFTFSKDGLTLKYAGVNSFETTIAGKFPDAEMGFNAALVEAALASCGCPEPTVSLENDNRGLRFSHGNYMAIVRSLVEKK